MQKVTYQNQFLSNHEKNYKEFKEKNLKEYKFVYLNKKTITT
jgi:hypothetical protein